MKACVALLVVWISLGAFGGFGASDAHAAPARGSDVAIGDFELVRVVDGDTLRVKGLESSLRLLGIDTEETFKHDAERRRYAKGFAAYARAARGASPRPAKFATPLGDEAKRWAEAWFAGVTTVRLERDDPHEIQDRYHRYLAYVLVEKHGRWLNYNVEAVRAGMSPYFPKYGRSRRFDRDFVAAEAEAKAAGRGIWAAGAEAYSDYPEREAWWGARGAFVAAFRGEATAAGHATMIDLTHDDAAALLEANLGREVVVLGTVGEVDRPGAASAHPRGRRGAKKRRAAAAHDDADDAPDDARDHAQDETPDEGDPGAEASPRREGADAGASGARPPPGRPPARVELDGHLTLVFFAPDVFAASRIAAWKGEWIRATGRPSRYHGRLELAIDRVDQLALSAVPGLAAPSAPAPRRSRRNRDRSVPIPAP